MNQIIRRLASLCLIAGMLFALTPMVSMDAYAGPKKKNPVVHDTVSAITSNSITVSGKNGERTYGIGQYTEILVNGQHGGVASIAVGMHVMVGADSNGVASLINAQTPPQR
jgi:hypothetical protein